MTPPQPRDRQPAAWKRLAWLALLGATGAAAQVTTTAPSEAVACMTPEVAQRGLPEYPKALEQQREEALVEVQLEFTSPDSAPRVRLLELKGDRAFEESVRRHVSRYRVPCLQPGQQASIRQSFQFVMGESGRVNWSTPTDEEEARARQLARCLAMPAERPQYPRGALERRAQGTVALSLRFMAPDRPPEVKVLTNGGDMALGRTSIAYANGLRLPCHDGRDVTLFFFLQYHFEGAPRSWFNDVQLPSLVRALVKPDALQAYFDTRDMGCPFELQMRMTQPYTRNNVGEVGPPDPRRQPLMDWLSRQTLKLDDRQRQLTLAHSLTVQVPCMVLDLTRSVGGGGTP